MKKSPKSNNTDLSVVILNYNAGKYLDLCLQSIKDSDFGKYKIEIIVVDNNSTDNSFETAQSTYQEKYFKFVKLPQNIGFAAGNNRGLTHSDPNSRYVLFLNPDTTVENNTFKGMIEYLDSHPKIDAATCWVTLKLTGQLQDECHRGFPTPINTFWHFFGFGLPKLFPKSKFFNGYLLSYLDYSKLQKIDCCVGAFFMLRRHVGESIGWWNEKYFFYGEDLDFCYKLRKHGFTLYFVPDYKITHFQGISSGIKKTKSAASRATKVRVAKASTDAMRIFYRENLIQDYPLPLQWLVWTGIKFLEIFRVFKAKYL